MNHPSPPPDDLDRKTSGSGSVDPLGDSDEYELEPPDEEVLATLKQHAEQTIVAASNRIDIDAIYSEDKPDVGDEAFGDWMNDARSHFRFQVKHLLIATAVLAVLLTIDKLTGNHGATLLIVLAASVGGALFYISKKERLHEAKQEEKRREMFQRHRKFIAGELTDASAIEDASSGTEDNRQEIADFPDTTDTTET